MTFKTILAAAAIAFTAIPAMADVAWNEAVARASFENLPMASRQNVQTVMKEAGTYGSSVDGKWGPGTARGVLETAKFLEMNSYNKLNFELNSRQAAAGFYAFVISPKAGAYLWGEGGECDGC